MNKRHQAFTLVEILVVLAIIAILAALLFPAFGRAREGARQTSCSSNLQQIGFAVLQYRKDEGEYPDTLVDILAEGATVASPVDTATNYKLGAKATGYLKGGQDTLLCPNDDTLPPTAGGRSSYGFLSKSAPTPVLAPLPAVVPTATEADKFVWNYWGYRRDGFAYATPIEAQTANGGGTTCAATPATAQCLDLQNPSANYSIQSNPVKYSMSNRFAPSTTIVTHCVFHRLQTADNINFPSELYGPAPISSTNAKDIVLRIDGSVKAIDVAKWNPAAPADSVWQKQTP